MKTGGFAVAVAVSLLLAPSARADRDLGLRGGGDRLERPQWERNNLRVEKVERQQVERAAGIESVRPDPARERGNPVDGADRTSRISSGVRVQATLAGLRPGASRDAFLPVDDKGVARGLRTGLNIEKDLSGMRPDPDRDRVNPVDDAKGTPRGLGRGVRVARNLSGLRPDPNRDAFLPIDETTGQPRGIPAELMVEKGYPSLLLQLLRQRVQDAAGDCGTSGPLDCR